MAEQYSGQTFFTYDEAANYLRVTVRFLKEKVYAGAIPAVRLGHATIRFRQRDLDRWAEQQLATGPGVVAGSATPKRRSGNDDA